MLGQLVARNAIDIIPVVAEARITQPHSQLRHFRCPAVLINALQISEMLYIAPVLGRHDPAREPSHPHHTVTNRVMVTLAHKLLQPSVIVGLGHIEQRQKVHDVPVEMAVKHPVFISLDPLERSVFPHPRLQLEADYSPRQVQCVLIPFVFVSSHQCAHLITVIKLHSFHALRIHKRFVRAVIRNDGRTPQRPNPLAIRREVTFPGVIGSVTNPDGALLQA